MIALNPVIALNPAITLNPLNSTSLLASLGALGIFLVLFAETGLLVGFFLPGDSLLFTAGLLCTTGATHKTHLSLPVVLLAAVGGALLGAETGFFIGRKAGKPMLDRSRSRFLRRGAERSEAILARYGFGKAIVLARFVPVVRTVLNPMAGALDLPVRTFTIWQSVGGVIWSVGLTMLGYALGSTISNVDAYLLPIIGLIVLISLLPITIELIRAKARSGRGGQPGASQPSPAGDKTSSQGNATRREGRPAA